MALKMEQQVTKKIFRRKNPKKEREPDDHIEAFEKRHKKAKADRE